MSKIVDHFGRFGITKGDVFCNPCIPSDYWPDIGQDLLSSYFCCSAIIPLWQAEKKKCTSLVATQLQQAKGIADEQLHEH